jgi:hypothetical protein
MSLPKIQALNFIVELMANVDNSTISDSEFREGIREFLFNVEKPFISTIGNDHIKPRIVRYYEDSEGEL